MTDPTTAKILQAAKEAFEARGYRVSMVDIAKRSGVAKQTLYNHFGSKEALFEAVFQNCTTDASSILRNQSLPLSEKLLAFAYAIRRMAMSTSGIAGYRAMTAEAHQFPELAASFYRQGVGVLHAQLQQVLQEAQDKGQMQQANVSLAADMLFSMLTGFERSRLLLGVAQGNDGQDSRVEPIVEAFMCAFAMTNKERVA